MSRIVYKKNNFIIFRAGDGFILQNTSRDFEHSHTHLNSFHIAKYIAIKAMQKKIPNDLSVYQLESLKRVINDRRCEDQIQDLINFKKEKKTNAVIYGNEMIVA